MGLAEELVMLHRVQTETRTVDGKSTTVVRCGYCAERYPCQTMQIVLAHHKREYDE